MTLEEPEFMEQVDPITDEQVGHLERLAELGLRFRDWRNTANGQFFNAANRLIVDLPTNTAMALLTGFGTLYAGQGFEQDFSRGSIATALIRAGVCTALTVSSGIYIKRAVSQPFLAARDVFNGVMMKINGDDGSSEAGHDVEFQSPLPAIEAPANPVLPIADNP